MSTVDGSTVAVFTIHDATNCDWEDITLGPGPDGHTYIYIGDVGGNASKYTLFQLVVMSDHSHFFLLTNFPDFSCILFQFSSAAQFYFHGPRLF